MKTTERVHRKAVRKSAPYQLENTAEFKVVRLRECPVAGPEMELSQQVVNFWRKHVVTAPWFKDTQECFCVFVLNARHRLVGFELVGLGTLNAVCIAAREVFRTAILHSAAAIIVAHNHPSGDPTPGADDINVTRDLIRAGHLLKIDLLDSIVIGDARQKRSYSSLRELGFFNSLAKAA